MTKLLIAGSREFCESRFRTFLPDENWNKLRNERIQFFNNVVDAYIAKNGKPSYIISGLAEGPDMLGYYYAKANDIPVMEFPADWSLGRHAGMLRNQEMGLEADYALIFWDGESKGTKNMIDILEKLNKPHEVFLYKSKQDKLF